MNSPEDKQQKPDENTSGSKRSTDNARQADEQNQATSEDFEEEGMGVAPKE